MKYSHCIPLPAKVKGDLQLVVFVVIRKLHPLFPTGKITVMSNNWRDKKKTTKSVIKIILGIKKAELLFAYSIHFLLVGWSLA